VTTLSGPRVPPRAEEPAHQLVVLLHGVGADGNDLISLAPVLAELLPHAAFVAPNAPEPYDMAPFGYQWYSLRDLGPESRELGVQAAAPALDAFLDAERDRYGLDDQNIALLGFSQGTMMALYVGPRRPRPLAGILGYSGVLVGVQRLSAEVRSRPPVCLIHGDRDELIQVQAMHAAVAGLQAADIPVRASVRPGLGHGIDPEGIAQGTAFLAEVLGQGERASGS
jgi:phospholipase/carboxylesterase